MSPDQMAILEVLAQQTQRLPTGLNADTVLSDLDIDSLKFIVVILEIEQRLNRDIFDIENVGQIRSVGDILKLAIEPQVA
jgi:acyl carrier protein